MSFDYQRRCSSVVKVGDTPLGGTNPIRLQSMTNTSTMDTAASVAQCIEIAAAGADYVRLTAQGEREAHNMGEIRRQIIQQGVLVPLVADIHFNPKAAFAAATEVEKVRINPGNFVDPGRTFRKIEYTDDEYATELLRIEKALIPFYELCRKHGTAVRIGVNHGSLSDRIMSRYGDTPAGMVESAMEFLRVARKVDFKDIVISIKASNTVIMVETVRRLVRAMDAEDMHFPLHLGVTEAGDGEDGRIKSAVGIGTLLADGIGDTIRVSLSESPANEIPVARALVDYITSRNGHDHIAGEKAPDFDPISPKRRTTAPSGLIGGDNPIAVLDIDSEAVYDPGFQPDVFTNDSEMKSAKGVIYLRSDHKNAPAEIAAEVHRMWRDGDTTPVVAVMRYDGLSYDDVALRAATDFGKLLIDRLVDGIMIDAPQLSAAQRASLAFRILQAARQRFTRTEFIACPGCGRTLFDLQSTLAKVKEATGHLKGLKIGVMGCVVNGPGEMADADFGYVGAGVGNVSLYRGKECVKKNIPAETALPQLIQLIKDSGRWIDPQ